MLICRFFLGIDYNFSIDYLSLAVILIRGGKRIIDDAFGITVELFFKIYVKFGEGGSGRPSAFHEDLLCDL